MSRPSKDQISKAVEFMGSIKFFPKESGAQEGIMRSLSDFVCDQKQLEWLTKTAVNFMPEWGGVTQLRALYCTRWKPLDGLEGGFCTVPGYTPNDNEGRAIEAPSQMALPAGTPSETTLDDAEKRRITELAEQVKQRAEPTSRPRRAGD